MTVKRLKELLNKFEDDTEIMIRNSMNVCGNISDLDQVEKATYSFFGQPINCIILNSSNSKYIEEDEEENIIDFIEM